MVSGNNHKEFLFSQIAETKRMLEMVRDHPLMAKSFEFKLANLEQELNTIPKDLKEARIKILFSGKAVIGSLGIKSNFVSKTIKPIQELLKTEVAMVRFGQVGQRGNTKKTLNSNLYLTALPRGSFGIELSHLNPTDLFNEKDISEAISNVMDLVESTASSDEDFEEIISKTPVRNINNLQKFLKVVVDEDSVLKMESGSKKLFLKEKEVSAALERLNSTATEEKEEIMSGMLRGVLLDSSRFEVTNEEGNIISGPISKELSEEDIFEFDRKYLNEKCEIHLKVITKTFKTGRSKSSYQLLDILPPKH